MNAIDHIMACAMEVAPSGEVQEAFRAMKELMEADGISEWDMVKNLADGIYNGLEYGNWPIKTFTVERKM